MVDGYKTMKQDNRVYFFHRKDWREWLKEHFDTASGVWLIYPKKHSGKKKISYNDAVEEALCFGWIDSVHKPLDPDHTMQRFSPRRAGSSFSQSNKERLRWLAEQDLLHPSIQEKVERVLREEFIFPKDIMEAIRQEKDAWVHYQKQSDSYKRIRIAYIDGARQRPEEFQKRLAHFIRKSREGKRIIGFGGVDKYY